MYVPVAGEDPLSTPILSSDQEPKIEKLSSRRLVYFVGSGMTILLASLLVYFLVFDKSANASDGGAAIETIFWNSSTSFSGNSVNYVTNKQIVLQGPLVLTDNATLVFQNSVLSLDMDGPDSVTVETSGTSRLTFIDSQVNQYASYCTISNWKFAGSSVVTMQNVERSCNWFTVNEDASFLASGGNTGLTLLAGFMGTVQIENDDELWLELFLSVGSITVTNVPQCGDPISSDSGFLQSLIDGGAWAGAKIDIQSCVAHQVDLGVTVGVYLTVTDTPSLSLSWSMGITSSDEGYGELQSIEGLKAGFFTDKQWVLGSSSVRLVNTGFASVWGAYWGSTQVKFTDCSLVDVNAMDSVIVLVEDSSMSSLIVSGSSAVELTGVSLIYQQPGTVLVEDDGKLTVTDSPDVSGDAVVTSGNGEVTYE